LTQLFSVFKFATQIPVIGLSQKFFSQKELHNMMDVTLKRRALTGLLSKAVCCNSVFTKQGMRKFLWGYIFTRLEKAEKLFVKPGNSLQYKITNMRPRCITSKNPL